MSQPTLNIIHVDVCESISTAHRKIVNGDLINFQSAGLLFRKFDYVR